MKRSFLVLLFLCIGLWSLGASIHRSDSVDIKQTTLYCDITDFVSKQIQAHANILIESKINGQNMVIFDLEGLQVDSVRWNGNPTTYVQTNIDVRIISPGVS